MTKVILAAALAGVAFAQSAAVPKPAVGAAKSRMSTVFREHGIPGLTVQTVADTPNFSAVIKEFLGREPDGIAATEMRWAMLVNNRSGRAIVSMTTGVARDGWGAAYTFFGRYPFQPGTFIGAGQRLLVFPQVSVHAGERVAKAEELGQGLPELERALSGAREVSICIDGVLFDDGAFYGLDESKMFSRLAAAVDMYREIFRSLAGKSDSEAVQILVGLAELRLPPDRPFSLSYGQEKALWQAVFNAKAGHLSSFLKRQPEIVAAVPEIHRGLRK
jgi:hypothetical protein